MAYPDEVKNALELRDALSLQIETSGHIIVTQEQVEDLIGALTTALFNTCSYIRNLERAN